MEAFLMMLLAIWVLSALGNAGSSPEQPRNEKARSESRSTPTIRRETRDEPRATGAVATPERQDVGGFEVATEVAWIRANWSELERGVAQLKFHSSWSFDRCVRDRDFAYGIPSSIWTLDLHGLDRALAKKAMRQFLSDLRSSDNRRCRIISGRGNNSRGEGVLPDLVYRELESLCRSGEVCEWEDLDGHFDVQLPPRPSTRGARKEPSRKLVAEASSARGNQAPGRWPCGHERGLGESHCWDCWFRNN